ncbi:MAG: RsmD family RNA methyltransferase [Planctomycetota bacterium]|nr:RsmD family RNA methyltransferase [Planctomycetota bacterium]
MRIISGSQRGRKLLGPRDSSARPALDSTREAVFSILGERVEGVEVLDLFCGVGAFGLEALSRGARRTQFVDSSPASLKILQRNIELLGFEAFTTVEQADAYRFALPPPGESASPGLIFSDPPFPVFKEEPGAQRVFSMVDRLLSSLPAQATATMVLRIPSWFRGEVPFRVEDRRDYGGSTLVFLSSTDFSGAST